MKLTSIAATVLLTTSLATPGLAQSLGAGAGATAGLGADASVGGAGTSLGGNAGANLNANAGASMATDGATGSNLNADANTRGDAGAAAQAAADLNIGTEVHSSDGVSIGTIAETRTNTAGGTQAVINVDESLGLAVRQVAISAASLTAGSESNLTIDIEAEDFRDRIHAQLEGGADARATAEGGESEG